MKLAYIVICYRSGSNYPTPMSLSFETKEKAKKYIDGLLADQNELNDIIYSKKEKDSVRFHQLIDQVDIFKATDDYDIISINVREE